MAPSQDLTVFRYLRRRSAPLTACAGLVAWFATATAWAAPKIEPLMPMRAANGDLQFVAKISVKGGKVFQPYLCYRTNRSDYNVVTLKHRSSGDWETTVAAKALAGTKLDYYFGAYDAADMSEGLWRSKAKPESMSLGARSTTAQGEAPRGQVAGGYSGNAVVATGDSVAKAGAAVATAAPTPAASAPPPPAAPPVLEPPAPKPAPAITPPVVKPPAPAAKTPPSPVVEKAPLGIKLPADSKNTDSAPTMKDPTAAKAKTAKPPPPKEVEEPVGRLSSSSKTHSAVADGDQPAGDSAPKPTPARARPPKATAPAAESVLNVTNLPPNYGYIRILCDPPEGNVGIDELEMGPGPINKNILPGDYLISGRLAGYREASRVVTIVAGSGKQVRLTLTPK